MVTARGVVLLVEDEAPVRAFASRALRMRGYTVLEADSGRSGAEDARRPANSTSTFFVTDVVMPGMDGPSWVREALKERPDTKVIFDLGLCRGQHRREPGPHTKTPVFLPKPFSLNQLTATVQAQIA